MKPACNRDYKLPASMDEIMFGGRFPAGVLINVNSGYRTFAPHVDTEKCSKCMLCFVYCPDGAIGKETGSPVIVMDYCKGCGICAKECPSHCIEMVKEEK